MASSPKNFANWYQYRNPARPIDSDTATKLDTSYYFALMGKCRDVALEEMWPNAAAYKKQGFGLVTESAHIEFARPGTTTDQVVVRMGCVSRTRTRMEFEFEFIGERDGRLLGKGRNAVVWVNPQQNPAVMPEELYNHAALQPASAASEPNRDDG